MERVEKLSYSKESKEDDNMKGRWRKYPTHISSPGESCPMCRLKKGFWNGLAFVDYNKEYPCPRCGYMKGVF